MLSQEIQYLNNSVKQFTYFKFNSEKMFKRLILKYLMIWVKKCE